jgi:Ca2+-dependent lipid-binding protein
MSGRVVIKLYDEDNITDEIVGSLLFNMKECINEKVTSTVQLIYDRMASSSGRISMELPWDAQVLTLRP